MHRNHKFHMCLYYLILNPTNILSDSKFAKAKRKRVPIQQNQEEIKCRETTNCHNNDIDRYLNSNKSSLFFEILSF